MKGVTALSFIRAGVEAVPCFCLVHDLSLICLLHGSKVIHTPPTVLGFYAMSQVPLSSLADTPVLPSQGSHRNGSLSSVDLVEVTPLMRPELLLQIHGYYSFPISSSRCPKPL